MVGCKSDIWDKLKKNFCDIGHKTPKNGQNVRFVPYVRSIFFIFAKVKYESSTINTH